MSLNNSCLFCFDMLRSSKQQQQQQQHTLFAFPITNGIAKV